MKHDESAVEVARWAHEEFGHVQLGDSRRANRLVSIAAAVARHPAGKISEVMRTDAARQAAYDFLESDKVAALAILTAVGVACVARACQFPYLLALVDGSSLNLTDTGGVKGFGSVGSRAKGAVGLKMINAIGVSPDGVPQGVLAQQYWVRGARSSRPHRRANSRTRRLVTGSTQSTNASRASTSTRTRPFCGSSSTGRQTRRRRS